MGAASRNTGNAGCQRLRNDLKDGPPSALRLLILSEIANSLRVATSRNHMNLLTALARPSLARFYLTESFNLFMVRRTKEPIVNPLRYYFGPSKSEPKCKTDREGNKRWYLKGELHREDGPAVEWVDGSKAWFRHDTRHRVDGPAVEYASGTKEWWRDGKFHRDDGPAVESANGDKKWFRNGQRHRDDGPAVEWANGDKEWWRDGKLHREDGPAIARADGGWEWYLRGLQVKAEMPQFNEIIWGHASVLGRISSEPRPKGEVPSPRRLRLTL